MNNKNWLVYLIRCSDNSLYCGVTNNFKNRLIEHNSGKGAKYTRSRRPVELVGISPEMTKSEALKLEYRIKQLPANKKISKLKGKENEMTILKKDLQALNKDIQALGKTIDKLIAVVEKGETTKVAKKTTVKPIKAKTTKRSPAQKAPARKKTAQPTATDQVIGIINGAKNGVNTATLMKKTGFDQRKIWSIINRASKAGKIKRAGRGVYVGA
jgi:putative endonuclease